MKEWICREMSTSTSDNENGVLMMKIELIRCKDCKIEPRCLMYRHNKDPYGFCKWAERKEE